MCDGVRRGWRRPKTRGDRSSERDASMCDEGEACRSVCSAVGRSARDWERSFVATKPDVGIAPIIAIQRASTAFQKRTSSCIIAGRVQDRRFRLSYEEDL